MIKVCAKLFHIRQIKVKNLENQKNQNQRSRIASDTDTNHTINIKDQSQEYHEEIGGVIKAQINNTIGGIFIIWITSLHPPLLFSYSREMSLTPLWGYQ